MLFSLKGGRRKFVPLKTFDLDAVMGLRWKNWDRKWKGLRSIVYSSQTKNSNLKITRFQKERFSYISFKGNQKHWIHDSTGQGKIKTYNFKQNFKLSKKKFVFKIKTNLTIYINGEEETFLSGRYFIKLL